MACVKPGGKLKNTSDYYHWLGHRWDGARRRRGREDMATSPEGVFDRVDEQDLMGTETRSHGDGWRSILAARSRPGEMTVINS